MSGYPLCMPIGILAFLFLVIGGWMWNQPDKSKKPHQLPLSQQPAKNKIYAGLPGIVLFIFSLFMETGQYQLELKMLSLFLIAYALVGLIELNLGGSISRAEEKWEKFSAWKKIIFSTFVIVTAIIIAINLMIFLFR